MYAALQAVLSLYASGRTTGIMSDYDNGCRAFTTSAAMEWPSGWYSRHRFHVLRREASHQYLQGFFRKQTAGIAASSKSIDQLVYLTGVLFDPSDRLPSDALGKVDASSAKIFQLASFMRQQHLHTSEERLASQTELASRPRR